MSETTALATQTAPQTPAKRTDNKPVTFRGLIESPAYQTRLQAILKEKAPQFTVSLTGIVNSSPALQKCDPSSIFASAMIAAALDLPIEKNLGFAHIVPYGGQAQFQIGYKGLIQLAVRSGQYRFLNACEVREGELVKHSRLTGEIEIDPDKRTSETVVGYAAYFRLVNGYEHAEYWPRADVEAHAKRYSQAYAKGYDTPWKSNFDAMALKTVIKDLISHWGIMSVQLQRAVMEDQGAKDDLDGATTYPDNMAPARPQMGQPPTDIQATVTTDAPPVEGQNTEGEKKRGRPAGSKNKPKEEAAQTTQPAEANADTKGQAGEPPAPAEQKPPTEVNEDSPPHVLLLSVIEKSMIPEPKFCQWFCAKYRLSPCDTIKDINDLAPARIFKVLNEFPSLEAEIQEACK